MLNLHNKGKRLAISTLPPILDPICWHMLISLLFNMVVWQSGELLFSNVVAVTVITPGFSLWFLGYHFIELWRHSVLEKADGERTDQ